MNRKLSTLMLAAAALLASCSQDDALQNTENTNEGLKPMTITASLPTDGMQTRAEGDDSGDATATRCYMQILNGDGTELAGGNSKPIKMDPDGKSFTTTVYLRLPLLGGHGSYRCCRSCGFESRGIHQRENHRVGWK